MSIAKRKNPVRYWQGKKRPAFSAWQTGRKHSEETKRKIGLKSAGRIHAEETRRKISVGNKGKHTITEEMRNKMNSGKKGKAYIPWNKGIRCPQFSGENHPRWRGGYENTLLLNNQRRVKKTGNGGSHTLAEWSLLKERHNFVCPKCNKKEPEIKLSRDHIIPLSKGGSDNIENIQPLCKPCNSSKHTKVVFYAK